MKNYPKITAAIVLVFVLVISIIVKQLVPLFVNNEGQTVSSQTSSIAAEQTNTEPVVSNTEEEEEENAPPEEPVNASAGSMGTVYEFDYEQ